MPRQALPAPPEFRFYRLKNDIPLISGVMTDNTPPSRRKLAFYALGTASTGLANGVLAAFTLPIFNILLGLNPAWIGMVGVGTGIIAAFLDPVIGRVSAMSLYAAALLPRIAFAMPSCYFCTARDSIMAMNHCEKNYIPGILKVAEMSDIAGLAAPKPLVIVAGRKDPMFPIAATRRAFQSLREIYSACGATERCHLVVGPEGHRFYSDLAWPLMMKEMEKM